MPSASTKNLRRLVVGFWMVNLIVGLLVVAAWFSMRYAWAQKKEAQ